MLRSGVGIVGRTSADNGEPLAVGRKWPAAPLPQRSVGVPKSKLGEGRPHPRTPRGNADPLAPGLGEIGEMGLRAHLRSPRSGKSQSSEGAW